MDFGMTAGRLGAAMLVVLAGLALCAPGGVVARRAEAVARNGAEPSVNSIGMRLVRIPAGEFQMGSTPEEPGHVPNEAPAHRVRITRAFEMGVHEVTNGQFRAFIEATGYRTEAERDLGGGFGIDFERAEVVQDPKHTWRDPGFPDFAPGDDHPVLMISWKDAEGFCRWLSAKEGRAYRLPTEAEWEYAARGGTTTPWWPGADPSALAKAANTADRALRERVPKASWAGEWDDGFPFLAPVGSFRPNHFGLHDMTGNVWEWCHDWYRADYYEGSPVDDPGGPEFGRFRTIRGGGWFNDAKQNRSAQRIYFNPTFRYCLLSGFRVVRELEP
jgi:formylglycine-generating enzyme required for sulfatase activity